MKKIVSLLLAILCISGMLIIPAYAAAYPSISTKAYIETKAEIQIDVYKNKWRTTRGTCSPAKSYYAYIDPDDTIKILAIYTNADSALVEYPTSSGKRKGYVKLDTLFYHAPKFDFKATASANTYVRPYGAKYGSIAKGDTVYHVGESNNHVLVIYTAKSGSRAYKLAYVTNKDFNKINSNSSNKAIVNNASNSGKEIKVTFVASSADEWKDLLNTKKKNAEDIIDVVNNVNLRASIAKVTGVSYVALISCNPAKLLDVLGEDSVIGLANCLLTEQYFNEAYSAHKKYNSLAKNITTEKDATIAFETFVEALSKYNAVIEANIGTIDRYIVRGNFRKDMLKIYLSSIAESSIPASEYKAVVNACKIANTTADIMETVGSKYSGYKAMIETRDRWYSVWNRIK